MDGDPSRGHPPSRDRLPPPYDAHYRGPGPARDGPPHMRPHPDGARRYSRPELDPPPLHGRIPARWSDRDGASTQFNPHDPPPHQGVPAYPRYADPITPRPAPLPPSDLPRSSRLIKPDEYYAQHHSSLAASQEAAIPTHLHAPRLTRFEAEPHLPEHRPGVFVPPEARDLHRLPRRTSGDPKARADTYGEAPLYPARASALRPSDPRLEPPPARPHSPGAITYSYPSAPPPRRISEPSPPRGTDPKEMALHRDKRARLEPYPERAQPSAAMLQPPPYASASSRRSASSMVTDWTENAGQRDRRPRDPVDAPYYADAPPSRGGARAADWVESGKGELSRRTSGYSHNTFESGHDRSHVSEAFSLNSQSSKVKRRKRAVLSCTECKQRKIKCDRNVPNCGSCVRRGVAHLCRWGDERDFLSAAPTSNITPSNAALMARIAQLESQVRVLQSASSSPTAAHDHAASERNADRSTSGKYGPASISSDGRSSRFSGPTSIQNPPNFTSRERIVHSKNFGGNEDDDLEEEEEEESDQSEDSESAESGAENAGDLLQALARGSSLKKRSGAKPTSRDATSSSKITSKRDETQSAQPTSVRNAVGNSQENGKDGAQSKLSSAAEQRRASGMSEENVTSVATFDMFASSIHTNKRSNIQADLLTALDLLPPRPKTNALVDFYLREAEPLVQSIHEPSFLRQRDRFWAALDQLQSGGNHSAPLPDLQFAALLLAICEAASEFMTLKEVLESEIGKSRTSIGDQLTLLVRGSLSLLGKAQFVRHPNIWGLQAIVTLRHYCFNRDHREEYVILCTMAIKAAEFMGLHKLGSALVDEERWQDEHRLASPVDGEARDASAKSSHRWKMLTSTRIQDGAETDSEGEDLDPDRCERKDMNSMWLPRGSRRKDWEVAASKRYKEGSRVDREVGRKVWFAFATMDWLCAAYFDRCYSCKDEMFSTQSPQNIDDADLTDSEPTVLEATKATDPHRRPTSHFLNHIRTTDVPTTNSFIPIHIEISHTVRSIADAQNHGDGSFETVLAIEARFREILRSLPRFFRLDGESEYDPEVHRHHRERPYLSVQRAVIHAYVHHRLLKLHRLYMSRGYWNAKYIHSTRTCIESARVVIGVLRALDHVGCRAQRYWIFKFNIFHAVLALQVDLLYLARQPVSREILAKRADVVSGLKMLHARTDVEGRNPLLASSLKVIKVLSEEEKARRAGGSEGSATSDAAPVTSSPSGSSLSSKKGKARGWTGASESTGDLAEHLERRTKETWFTVEVESLRARAEAGSNLGTEDGPTNRPGSRVAAISRTPSTEDGSSLHTAESDRKPSELLAELDPDADLARIKVQPVPGQERRETELDDYLKVLSSYQNPDDAPDGAHFFDVLDDLVYEIDDPAKMPTGLRGMPLLRTADDLAMAGAGFDAFTAA